MADIHLRGVCKPGTVRVIERVDLDITGTVSSWCSSVPSLRQIDPAAVDRRLEDITAGEVNVHRWPPGQRRYRPPAQRGWRWCFSRTPCIRTCRFSTTWHSV